jgi:hypothetical protein
MERKILSGNHHMNNFKIIMMGSSRIFFSICFFALITITFTSCEENMWLRSEKKLRNDIQGTWNRLFVTSHVTANEYWTFKDGVIAITTVEITGSSLDDGYADVNKTDGQDTLTLDYGNYNVDAKIDNAYLRLSGLEENIIESAKQGLNAKWTIVDIDSKTFYIAAENGSAIIQREFEKK